MSKPGKILGGLVLTSALLGYITWRVFLQVGKEVPTCVQTTYAVSRAEVDHFDQVLVDALRIAEVPEVPASKRGARYALSDDTWVRWEHPSHGALDGQTLVHICQMDTGSDSWRGVHDLVDFKLSEKYRIEKATLRRNPRLFSCSPSCNVELSTSKVNAELSEYLARDRR